MTYNILNCNGGGTEHAWEERKSSLATLVSGRSPDLLLVQEAYYSQLTYLEDLLGVYRFAGVGRDDGVQEGEFSAVFYKKDRFRLLSSQTRWFSETPDIPSRGWDAHHHRICSSALLEEEDGQRLTAASLHIDHAGVLARTNSARQLRGFFENEQNQCIVGGDFNFRPDSEPYGIIASPPLYDARLSAPEYSDFGTFHGFRGLEAVCTRGPIDHIFMTKGAYSPVRAEILAVKREGRYPSDHFPLLISFKKN